MKNITRYSVRLLLALSVFSVQLRAEVTATDGVTAAPSTFTPGVNVIAFNKNNGKLYTGLVETGADSTFRIASIARPTTAASAAAPTFTGLASSFAIATAGGAGVNLLRARIDQLTIIPNAPLTGTTATQETLVFLGGVDAAGADGITLATRPVAMTSLGTAITQAAAANITDANAATVGGRVLALRGTSTRLLAVVQQTTQTDGTWGARRDDTVNITTVTGDAATITTYAFARFASGVRPAVSLQTATVVEGSIYPFAGATTGTAAAFLDAHYDDILGKCYVSSVATSAAGAVTDVIFGFVIFDVANATNAANGMLMVPQAGVNDATRQAAVTRNIGATDNSGDQLKIVAATATAGVTARVVRLRKIRTLHTSAGYPYLIVQGGAETTGADTLFNSIRAVPLVRANSPYAGRLAVLDLDTPDTPVATGSANDNALPLSTEANATVVGGGVLPANAAANISDMQVVGTTVYVSIDVAAGAANEPGLYYSQAVLNDIGKVANWTDWAKVVKDDTAGTAVNVGRCYRSAVDAAGGRIWTVPGGVAETNRTFVKMTTWATSGATTTLQGQINGILNGSPCYSVFDLNNSERTFALAGTGVLSRYAFFGGLNKVVAIRTAISTAAGYGSAGIIERQPADWSAAISAAVDISAGLADAGPIVALGWTGRATGTDINYLLAGSPRGLYAFRRNVAPVGLDIADTAGDGTNTIIGAMNAVPFTGTFSWQLTGLTEPVLNIVTDNNFAYVHTRTINSSGVSIDRVYRIGGATTTVALITDAAVMIKIAETGAGSAGTLSGVRCINGIALVAQNAGGTVNELALATDQGVYISRNGNIITSTEANAAFTRVSAPVEVRNLSSSHHSRIPATIWGTEQATSRYNQPGTVVGSYSTQEDLLHLGNNAAATIATGINFDGFNTNTANAFGDLSLISKSPGGVPTSHGFFTDGAFRIMLSDDFDGTSPHDVIRFLPWDVSSNLQGFNLSSLITIPDTALQTTATTPISEIYWIQRIAGHVCAGFDKGIAVLS